MHWRETSSASMISVERSSSPSKGLSLFMSCIALLRHCGKSWTCISPHLPTWPRERSSERNWWLCHSLLLSGLPTSLSCQRSLLTLILTLMLHPSQLLFSSPFTSTRGRERGRGSGGRGGGRGVAFREDHYCPFCKKQELLEDKGWKKHGQPE